MPSHQHRGRPLSSSREMLQEAAFELFLENGYTGTTVDAIAQRSGVSRATFFNYFPTKSDVFWVDLDESLGALRTALQSGDIETPVMSSVRNALLAVAEQFGPTRVPWALTHYAMIGGVHELQASAMVRLGAEARIISDFILRHRSNVGPGVDLGPNPGQNPGRNTSRELLASAAACAAIGATVAAALRWAQLGTTRGPLAPQLDTALIPLCDGYQRALDALTDG